jgi:hypothetical protein
MTAPIPTRFSEAELALLDQLVAEGVGQNRSEIVRLAVAELGDRVRRQKVGRSMAEEYRMHPDTAEEMAWAYANARAMVEAEPW